jgi:ferrous iron transport protein B
MSQVYLGGAGKTVPATPPALGQELLGIAGGFVTAAVDAGRILLSILPGVDLSPAGGQAGEDTLLSLALRGHFTALSALALLVFVLLYVPCVATLGAIRHEFGGGWAVASAVYQTGVAWAAAFVVYQGGRLLGFG